MHQPSQAPAQDTRPRTPYTRETVLAFRGRRSQAARENLDFGLPCHCAPYTDILTAGRWRALGHIIKRGESAVLRVGRFGNTPVFCRCQTTERDSESPAFDNRPAESKPLAQILEELPEDMRADVLQTAALYWHEHQAQLAAQQADSELPEGKYDAIPF